MRASGEQQPGGWRLRLGAGRATLGQLRDELAERLPDAGEEGELVAGVKARPGAAEASHQLNELLELVEHPLALVRRQQVPLARADVRVDTYVSRWRQALEERGQVLRRELSLAMDADRRPPGRERATELAAAEPQQRVLQRVGARSEQPKQKVRLGTKATDRIGAAQRRDPEGALSRGGDLIEVRKQPGPLGGGKARIEDELVPAWIAGRLAMNGTVAERRGGVG